MIDDLPSGPMTDEQRNTLNKIWALIFDWHETGGSGMKAITASERIEVALLSLITRKARRDEQ